MKMSVDSKGYQSGMDQAAKSLDKFQKQNLSTAAAMKTVTTTLSKYISVAALAKGAVDAFNATIRGSQTTSDKFDASMRAAETAVNTFFSSLSTGDFSQFNLGLDNLIKKSGEAYRALDRLGNASMSWNYFYSEGMADITELQLISKDRTKPMEERKAAALQMQTIQQDLSSYAAGYSQRAREAMAKVMTEATSLEWTDVSEADLRNVLRLDLLDVNMSQEEKARLKARYQEYLDEVKKYEDWFNKEVRVYEKRAIKDSFGATVAWGKVDVTSQEDLDLRAQDLRDIASEYQDAVLFNQVLVRGSNEWLQDLIQLVAQANAAERSMRSINRAVLESKNSLLAGDETPKGTTPSVPKTNYMSSLEIDRMMYQGRIQLAEQFSEEWVALKQGLRETEYQMEVERRRTTIQNEDDLTAALKLAEQVLQKDLYNIAMEGYAQRLKFRTGDIEQSTETITGNINSMRDSLSGIGDGARAFEQLGHAMTQLSENKAWQGVGNAVAGVGSAIQAYMQLASAAQIAAAAEGAAETPTVWGKIATVTALIATFTTAATQIRAMNNYAEGGIVPGRNWNDGITARVSSGEMYINEADQKRLFDAIHTGNLGGGGGGPAVITGEQIVLAINNYGRRTNRGEMVFAGR